jgi:hypothetical protein
MKKSTKRVNIWYLLSETFHEDRTQVTVPLESVTGIEHVHTEVAEAGFEEVILAAVRTLPHIQALCSFSRVVNNPLVIRQDLLLSPSHTFFPFIFKALRLIYPPFYLFLSLYFFTVSCLYLFLLPLSFS